MPFTFAPMPLPPVINPPLYLPAHMESKNPLELIRAQSLLNGHPPLGPSINLTAKKHTRQPHNLDPTPLVQARSRKAAADKARRQRKRAKNREQQPGRPLPFIAKKYSKPPALVADFNAQRLSAATGASISKHLISKQEWSLDELIENGFNVVPWDGCMPILITDKEDRIIVVLAGRPRCAEWADVHAEMSQLLEQAGKEVQARCKERRGEFISLSTGVSCGIGQEAPGNLVHSKSDQEIIDRLTQHKAFRRAAGFMCSAFASYAPKLYQEYLEHITPLFSNDPSLRKVFKNSIFPVCIFNCGSQHVDSTNDPFGLSAIFTCGSYDHTKRGHLILFDLNLVVQFPPGSTILVPSGTIRHGYVTIQPKETRQSFTQYCPGSLFHWAEYGSQQAQSSPAKLKRYFSETHNACCKRFVELFSNIDQLAQDRRTVFNLKYSG